MLVMQVLFVFHAGTWHGFWTSSSHGNSMGFAEKMMGFPSDSVSFSSNLSSKRHYVYMWIMFRIGMTIEMTTDSFF